MKLRESGMPEKERWESYFSSSDIIKKFNFDKIVEPVVDAACGYGTFAIPLARMLTQNIYAVDINKDYLNFIKNQSLENISAIEYDIFEHKLKLPKMVGAILLFNILHCENPLNVINNVLDNLLPNGKIFVIHWRSDIVTPGGPPLTIRPKPHEITNLFKRIKFERIDFFKDISQYHYGFSFQRRK